MTEPFLRFLWLISSPRTKLLELFFVHLRELQASERSESSRFSKTKEVKLPCFLPDPTGLRLSSSPELPSKSRGRRAREGTDAVLANGTFSSPHTQSSCRRVAQSVKRPPTMWETRVLSLGREDPLEKEMATHSSTVAWKIPWTEKPGRLQSMGLQRVRHD